MVFCWSCGARFVPLYEGNRACEECVVYMALARLDRDLDTLLAPDHPDG
jgi:hypothetical protein